MNVVKIVLKVKSPILETKELDFTEKTDEILEAVSIFNDKFRDWSKRIIITQITKRAIHLLMVLEKATVAENLSVREIRFFIQYLRNEKGWSAYTREKNKMFETVEFYRPDKEALDTCLEKVKSRNTLFEAQKLDIEFMNENETVSAIGENRTTEMEDDDMITVLNYLVKTQNKGPKASDKAEDLAKMKLILSKWL